MADKETRKKKIPRPEDVEYVQFKPADSFQIEYCAMLTDHIAKGFSFASFDVGVTNATMSRWLYDHPEFSAAREKGERKKLQVLEAAGMRMAVVDSNVSAWKLLMSQHGVVEKSATVQHHIHENINTRSEPEKIEASNHREARKERIRELAADLQIDLSESKAIEGEVVDVD